jgi:hypothetical protein
MLKRLPAHSMHVLFAYLLVTPDCLGNDIGEAIILPLIWCNYIGYYFSAASI